MLIGLGFLTTLGGVMLLSVAGYMAPNMYLYQLGYDRTQKIQRALPDAIDLLTISVESGLGFDAALAQVARNTEGPLADEFALVLQEMQIGLGRGAALRALGDRTHVADVKGFVSSMVQGDLTVHWIQNGGGQRRFVEPAVLNELAKSGWTEVREEGVPSPVDSAATLLTVSGALARTAEGDRPVLTRRLERAEDPKFLHSRGLYHRPPTVS
jgi:hypothetical protein